MHTVIIDIINDKALKLLKDLELLQLIRMRKEDTGLTPTFNGWALKYKGAMSKQFTYDVDKQLNALRIE